MSELEQLTALCAKLGATPTQAAVMAAQMLKRAEQLARERNIDRTDALAHLINVVVSGRAGELPGNSETGKTP